MKIKKLIFKTGVGLATVGIIVAGAAAFSAFEAHVVNVTATIENALTVPVEQSGLTFGEMFPQEVSHVTLPISLSSSFLTADRVDDIEYMIRQKPKCGIPTVGEVASGTPISYSGFTQVTENADGTFICPAGSVQLPLLCPYLSKNELDATGKPTGNGIVAFHGLPGPWTETTTENTQVTGVLSKELGKLSTSWDIDLHTPCFKGQCAQDWATFVHDTNPSVTDPTIYEADPANEHQMFGCDLWVEVTNISLPSTTTNNSLLTVTKIVDNTGGGTGTTSDFSLFVDGVQVTSGSSTIVTAGAHVVSEGPHAGYNSVIGGDCTVGGNVTTSTSTPMFCTITNTFTPVNGNLVVHKIVVGSNADPNSFTLRVDDNVVTNDATTTQTAGLHVVTEDPNASFTTTFGGDCDASGNVTVVASTTEVCNVTNTLKPQSGQLTVTKIVDNSGGVGTKQVSDFSLFVDGASVTSGVATTTAAGSHVVTETSDPNYTASFSGDCDVNGNVTVPSNGTANCTLTNTAKFFTLTVTKTVVNINGGTATTSDFSFFVNATQVNSGVAHNFAPGTYTVTESGVTGYVATFGGDCNASTQQVTGANGDTKNCTIVNHDLPPIITLVKSVVGGTATATQFIMRVDGIPVPTGGSKSVTSNATHTIDEDAFTGYHFTSMSGTGTQGDVCPSTLGGTVTLKPGEDITCTITNTVNP